MLSRDEDILKAAEDWRKAGRGVALATVVETWGSAPRPVGSNLVIDNAGNFLGSVSGGCVEGAVVTEAIDVIESGKSKMLEFGVADEAAWNVGLSCGGTIRVDVAKDPLRELLEKRLRMAKSGMEETAQGKVFLTVHVPSPQLVITGAVHISQVLAPIATLLDYDVTI